MPIYFVFDFKTGDMAAILCLYLYIAYISKSIQDNHRVTIGDG